MTRADLHPFVATNASAEDVQALAEQHHLPFPKLEHGFVTTLIKTNDKLIAFDPGFGENAPMPSAGYFNKSLEQAGYSVSDIDMVVISHSQPDHIGNLMTGGEPTFPNAEIVYGRSEYDYWKRGENISDMRKPTLAMFQKVAVPLAERMRFIEPDESIVSGLTAINAFGHSAGHLAFHFEQGKQRIVMLNDTVAHCAASLHEDMTGIMASANKGLIVAECSTLTIEDKTLAHNALHDAGIVLLDCPISGTDSQAATTFDVIKAGAGMELQLRSPSPMAWPRQ